jgi:hypothetical protein
LALSVSFLRVTANHAAHNRSDTPSEGKLFSLFEPSTEIIRKGKAGKPNEFGKMVKLQEAENQIVTDYEVYERRPHDARWRHQSPPTRRASAACRVSSLPTRASTPPATRRWPKPKA